MKHLRNYKIFESDDSLNSLSDKDLMDRSHSLSSHLKWLEEEIEDAKKEISQIERMLYDRKSTGRYKYPDRLYNHKNGLDVLIKHDILTHNRETIQKDLSRYNSITVEITDDSECEYQWFVDDCRRANADFKFVQEVTHEGSRYLLFYTLVIYREHFEDFIDKIRLEKIEPMN